MRELLQEAWLSILGAACLLVGVWFWAMQSWAAPYMPVVIYVLAAAIVLGLAYWNHQAGQDAAESSHQAQPTSLSKESMTAHIAPMVIGALLCGLWLIAPVRSAAAGLASHLGVLPTHASHVDPSDSVRASACMSILKNQPEETHKLQTVLSNSPDLAQSCLQPAIEAGYPSATLLKQRTTGMLSDRLMDARQPLTEEQACGAARRLADLASRDAYRDLLQCALEAPSPVARQCCTDTLDLEPSLADMAGPPSELSDTAAQILLRPLAERIFFAGKKRSQDGPVWATPANSSWLWALVCDMAGRRTATVQNAAVRMLSGVAGTLSCGWDTAPPDAVLASMPWPTICMEIDEADAAPPSNEAICPVLVPWLVDAAVSVAIETVHGAIASVGLRPAIDGVVATPIGAGTPPSEDEEFRSRIDSLTLAEIYGTDDSGRPNVPGCNGCSVTQIPGAKRVLNTGASRKIDSSAIDLGGQNGNTTLKQAKDKLERVKGSGELDLDAAAGRDSLEQTFGEKNADPVMEDVEKGVDQR